MKLPPRPITKSKEALPEMKHAVARPSEEYLKELGETKNPARVESLQTQIKQFLIDGTKHATELKAYQKILSDAQRNSRSDPNNELWLAQLDEKTQSHQRCLDAIDALISQTVESIDRHSRSEAITIINSLVSAGFFDRPALSSKNPSSASSSTDNISTSFKTIEKSLENERKEREDLVQSLKREFEQYKEFNSAQLKTLEQDLSQHKQSNETRFKELAETHRKEINSLKAGYQLAQIKRNTFEPKQLTPPVAQTQALVETQLDHPGNLKQEQLKQIISQHIQQELANQLNHHNQQIDLNKQAVQNLIEEIRTELDQLNRNTTSTLEEFQPEIKRVTNSIQLEVIKSTKTVISDGHQDISFLIQDTFTKLEERFDKLEPIVNHSTTQIQQLDSANKTLETQIDSASKTLETQINETLESKLKEVSDRIETIRSESSQKENVNKIAHSNQKQIAHLQSEIRSVQSRADKWRNELTKSIGEFKPIMTESRSEFGRIKNDIQNLVDRIDEIEKHNAEDNSRLRVSTPAPLSDHPAQHRSSHTPPSPQSTRRMSQSTAELTRNSPTSGYHIYQRPQELVQHPNKVVNDYHLAPTSTNASNQSQNIPIAARFTSAPLLNTAPSGSSANNHHTYLADQASNPNPNNPILKRNRSREASLSVAPNWNSNNNHPHPQAAGGVRNGGMNGAAVNPNIKSNYQHSNYDTRETLSDLQPQNQQNRFGNQFNAPAPLPPSTVPLAKRLKADPPPNQHYHYSAGNQNDRLKNNPNPLMNSIATTNYNPHHYVNPNAQNQKKFNQQAFRRN